MQPTRPAAEAALIRILVNPAAGHGAARRALPALERLAGEAGVALVRTGSREELVAEAARAADDGLERVLVAGGDGTLHHAVQALAERPTALAIVPVGSGNDFAATVGMPKDVPAAFEAARTGPVRELDLGRVGEGAAARWFAGVAGVGFDSEVARTILEGGRRGVGRLFRGSALYVYGVLRTLGSFRPPHLTLEHEGGAWDGRIMLVACGNTHRFGGGMRIAPNAVPDDGLLDVVIVKAIHKLTLLRVFPKVYQGTHLSHPAVETFRARRLTLHLDREMTVFGDGEPMVSVGEAGVRVEVVPRALRVVSPLA
jgi:diacylglycerol kinase (ATP)